MRIYQKYILKLYLSSFVKSLIFLSSILISVQTLNIAGDLADESLVGLQDLAIVSFHIIPYIIYSITPFSVGLSTAVVMNELLSTSQVVVLRNAGVSAISLAKTQGIVLFPIFLVMVFTSSFVLPKTSQVRTEIQNSIVKSRIKNFIIPESVKTLQNVTVITSPYNSLKHIPLTFIHQETGDGEFIFVGNIQDTWSNLNMLGIDANNATILITSKQDGEDLVKFQKLETQVNFFTNEENTMYIRHLNLPSLLKEYTKHKDDKYIQEINKRMIPAFSMILLMFGITILMVKLHKSRANYKIREISMIATLIFYIMFMPNNLNGTFHSIHNFWIIYANMLLTFLFIYFIEKATSRKDFFRKKHV